MGSRDNFLKGGMKKGAPLYVFSIWVHILSLQERGIHILANHMVVSSSEVLPIDFSLGSKVVLLRVTGCTSLHPNYTNATSYRTMVVKGMD